jgi:hypothetical protein
VDTEGELLTEPDDVRIPTLPAMDIRAITNSTLLRQADEEDVTTKNLRKSDLETASPFDSVAPAPVRPPTTRLKPENRFPTLARGSVSGEELDKIDCAEEVASESLFDFSDSEASGEDIPDLEMHRKAAAHLAPAARTPTWLLIVAAIVGAVVGTSLYVYASLFGTLPYYAIIPTVAGGWAAVVIWLCRASRLPAWISCPLAGLTTCIGLVGITAVLMAKLVLSGQNLASASFRELAHGLAELTGLTAPSAVLWWTALLVSLMVTSLLAAERKRSTAT